MMDIYCLTQVTNTILTITMIDNSQSHLNQWVQVVASYNGNKSKIFVNGQKVEESNSVNKNINTTRNARIGARS